MRLLKRNPYKDLPQPTKEEKKEYERLNNEIKVMEEEVGRFCQELIEKDLMVQVLTQAPQYLVNHINKAIYSTKLWKESLELKKQMDQGNLNTLEKV